MKSAFFLPCCLVQAWYRCLVLYCWVVEQDWNREMADKCFLLLYVVIQESRVNVSAFSFSWRVVCE